MGYRHSKTSCLCQLINCFFVIAFSDAQPTPMEEETYRLVHDVLQHSKRILLDLQLYQGAGNAIREVVLILYT